MPPLELRDLDAPPPLHYRAWSRLANIGDKTRVRIGYAGAAGIPRPSRMPQDARYAPLRVS